MLVGVKDIFHVDGWLTRAGSRLPPEALRGEEAASVSRLRRAGALVLGKTVTTEFAHFQPGPTRNPRNPDHTPGGSSSGSAAAVAAGYCDLALGTQTIGSIVRPAAFCGIVGVKPTYARIPMSGVIPLAPSLDHAGYFTPDVETAIRAAPVLLDEWDVTPRARHRPVLGVPEGPYLESAAADTREWFEAACGALADAGYDVRAVRVLSDFSVVRERHEIIQAAEAARTHARWFDRYSDLYGSRTAELIRRGRGIAPAALEAALAERDRFRDALRQRMHDSDVDAWIAPSSVGPAPRGLDSTGDPVMNLPWTHAGLPVISLPAGAHRNGLPLGLQIVGAWQRDEDLMFLALDMERVTRRL